MTNVLKVGGLFVLGVVFLAGGLVSTVEAADLDIRSGVSGVVATDWPAFWVEATYDVDLLPEDTIDGGEEKN